MHSRLTGQISNKNGHDMSERKRKEKRKNIFFLEKNKKKIGNQNKAKYLK